MIHSISPLWIALFLLGAFLLSLELGFRLGKRHFNQNDKWSEAHSGGTLGAMLALLGLLLAFTFSMSAERFTIRRHMVAEETNAIETAWMRCTLLTDSAARNKANELLQRYVEFRIAAYQADTNDAALEPDAHAEEIQRQIWALTSEAANRQRDPISSLVVLGVTNVVEKYGIQQAKYTNRVPDEILYAIAFAAFLTIGGMGYYHGRVYQRHFRLSVLLTLIITLTIFVILDLDHPRQGLMQVRYDSLIKLRDEMKAGLPVDFSKS